MFRSDNVFAVKGQPDVGSATGRLPKNDEHCRSRGGSFDYLSKGENAVQYMLMCCFDEELWAKLPGTHKGKIMQEYDELLQAIGKSGHLRASVKLQPSSTSTTVRENNGKPVITDGPFAETSIVSWRRPAHSPTPPVLESRAQGPEAARTVCYPETA